MKFEYEPSYSRLYKPYKLYIPYILVLLLHLLIHRIHQCLVHFFFLFTT